MRSISSTNMRFGGLGIGIPVKLYKSRDETRIAFHNGCACGGRVGHKNVCLTCGKEIPFNEMVKLYPMGDHDIVIDKAKLPKLESGDLTINGFMPMVELNKLYNGTMAMGFKEFYMLGFDKRSEKMVRPALEGLYSILKGKMLIGYGKIVLRSREQKVALVVVGKGLYLATLYEPSEVRENPFELNEVKSQKELVEFVESLTKPISEGFWEDKTREVIEALISGKEVSDQKIEVKSDFLTAIKKRAG